VLAVIQIVRVQSRGAEALSCRDEGSPTGWKLTVGPFPGWETVPSW